MSTYDKLTYLCILVGIYISNDVVMEIWYR